MTESVTNTNDAGTAKDVVAPRSSHCYAPFFESGSVTLYCGDALEILPTIDGDVMVTDPPYGISHASNRPGAPRRQRQIQNDDSTETRDAAMRMWQGPWIVFGTIKAAAPENKRGVLVWDKGGHVGMGDLSFPWKQNWELIYVGGDGFSGRRGTGVLAFNAIAPWAGKLTHPHEKPVSLMRELIGKCPPGIIVDPFAGSGSTLVAATLEGRRAVGIEIEERYAEIAANRLRQRLLF